MSVRVRLSAPTYAKATVGRPQIKDGLNKKLVRKFVGCPPKLYAKAGLYIVKYNDKLFLTHPLTRITMADCIFCKIIAKELPTEIVYENHDVIAIKDISPKAPTHLLIIPKKHINNVAALEDQDIEVAGRLLLAARDIAKKLGAGSFRLIANTGKEVGQSVFHTHLHFLAGKQMSDF